jgi:hypothetical protein
MMGGNPRVVLTKSDIPSYVEERIQSKAAEFKIKSGKDKVSDPFLMLKFGSLHGSVYTGDGGSCMLPQSVAEQICSLDLKLVRTRWWYFGMIWSAVFITIGLGLQIAGSQVGTLGSELMSVLLLLFTSVLRGAGLANTEPRMIPKWARRSGSSYGATLLGQMQSRAAGS